MEHLYCFCSVHFKRSLTRVCRNGALVPKDKAPAFKKSMIRLVTETMDLKAFKEIMSNNIKQFPKLGMWFHWYLQESRARITFPSLKVDYNPSELNHFFNIPDNNNAQESMGRQLQDTFPQRVKTMHVMHLVDYAKFNQKQKKKRIMLMMYMYTKTDVRVL